ncbi:CBS domain-containing protein [Hydromonas duriensis]|uniref:CBS domain-containing protein n=1 Tax=Hydromonas duriensis TaxID=1527608 RepID=A0A4V3DK83_9BURK|nr:CBS domain-containing protein [Hydromonas duriensis]TDR32827.1 CBS domain-containing protein [Hydromonas duriensis]
MKVADILKTKSFTLFTANPETELQTAVDLMAEKDLGSLVVLDAGILVGMLTFREINSSLSFTRGSIVGTLVGQVMDRSPLVLTSETDVHDTRQAMLDRHARYVPIIDNNVLMGVISFYDVAKAMLNAQALENKMLKAYIRDWPIEG